VSLHYCSPTRGIHNVISRLHPSLSWEHYYPVKYQIIVKAYCHSPACLTVAVFYVYRYERKFKYTFGEKQMLQNAKKITSDSCAESDGNWLITMSSERTSTNMIRLQSYQVHPTALTVIQHICSLKQKHTKYTQINTKRSTHSEMGPVWQSPIRRTVRIAHLSVLMTVHSFSTQYNTEKFW